MPVVVEGEAALADIAAVGVVALLDGDFELRLRHAQIAQFADDAFAQLAGGGDARPADALRQFADVLEHRRFLLAQFVEPFLAVLDAVQFGAGFVGVFQHQRQRCAVAPLERVDGFEPFFQFVQPRRVVFDRLRRSGAARSPVLRPARWLLRRGRNLL